LTTNTPSFSTSMSVAMWSAHERFSSRCASGRICISDSGTHFCVDGTSMRLFVVG
jgi:hypothetical protein